MRSLTSAACGDQTAAPAFGVVVVRIAAQQLAVDGRGLGPAALGEQALRALQEDSFALPFSPDCFFSSLDSASSAAKPSQRRRRRRCLFFRRGLRGRRWRWRGRGRGAATRRRRGHRRGALAPLPSFGAGTGRGAGAACAAPEPNPSPFPWGPAPPPTRPVAARRRGFLASAILLLAGGVGRRSRRRRGHAPLRLPWRAAPAPGPLALHRGPFLSRRRRRGKLSRPRAYRGVPCGPAAPLPRLVEAGRTPARLLALLLLLAPAPSRLGGGGTRRAAGFSSPIKESRLRGGIGRAPRAPACRLLVEPLAEVATLAASSLRSISSAGRRPRTASPGATGASARRLDASCRPASVPD